MSIETRLIGIAVNNRLRSTTVSLYYLTTLDTYWNCYREQFKGRESRLRYIAYKQTMEWAKLQNPELYKERYTSEVKL